MNPTRREIGALLSFLMPAGAEADELPSKTYPFDELQEKKSANGNRTRSVLNGRTHSGCPLEIHLTNLPAGGAPHPPHRHVHEEMILVQEGTMEVTISGRISRLGPGSVAYVASDEEHGWRNVGESRAQYFVIAIGKG